VVEAIYTVYACIGAILMEREDFKKVVVELQRLGDKQTQITKKINLLIQSVNQLSLDLTDVENRIEELERQGEPIEYIN
jgi:DNA repair exonuclease SbcCD ATPase subunit